MRWFWTFFSLLVLPVAYAEVSPADIDKMLNQMVSENIISAAEAEKAKIKMKSVSTQQWDEINKKAQGLVQARGPASVPSSNSVLEVKNIDLDGAQFKAIQEDIKKILPDMAK